MWCELECAETVMRYATMQATVNGDASFDEYTGNPMHLKDLYCDKTSSSGDYCRLKIANRRFTDWTASIHDEDDLDLYLYKSEWLDVSVTRLAA